MSAAHALEEAQHVAHAGHGGHEGHESHGDGNARLGMFIGVTMAVLGVILALCSAMVGSERTLLVQKLVEQQHAHAKYQAQDVKYRVSFLALAQVHATAFAGPEPTVNKATLLSLVQNVERYLAESALAKTWTNAYDGVIHAHMHAQEEYEHGLLASEIGIVVASIALMLRRRAAWYLSIGLGGVALYFVVATTLHVRHEVATQTAIIAAAEKKYEEARAANKTTKSEDELIRQLLAFAGDAPKPAAALPVVAADKPVAAAKPHN